MVGCNESNIIIQQHLCKLEQAREMGVACSPFEVDNEIHGFKENSILCVGVLYLLALARLLGSI